MYFRKIAIIIVIVVAVALPIFADEGKEAMFGLNWGMTPEIVKNLGVTLDKEDSKNNLEYYHTESLPKNVSDIEKYVLIFSENKLVKIIGVGKNITGDTIGSEGKERFDVINKSLQDKYGIPKHNDKIIGRKLFKDRDEFYQCLGYSGCGLWIAIYETSTKVIGLELKGIRRGTGFINLVVEAKPEWKHALEKSRSFKNKSDADAL